MRRPAPAPSHAHRRIADAIRFDRTANQSQWATRLGLSRQGISARMTGRTPWSLDEALEVAYHLNTTVDALRDGSYLAHRIIGDDLPAVLALDEAGAA